MSILPSRTGRVHQRRAAKKTQDEGNGTKGKTKTAEGEKEPREPRASTTDAQARIMKMADGGFRPAYNVQFATDTKSTAYRWCICRQYRLGQGQDGADE